MARVVTIQGLDEAVKKLEAIRKGYAAETLRPIFLKGAERMASIIEPFVPSATGRTRRALKAKLSRNQDVVRAFAFVDVDSIPNLKRDARGKTYRYPYIVDAGSPVHVIQPRKKGGKLRIGRSVVPYAIHPGFQPRRFFNRGVAAGRSVVRTQLLYDLQQVFQKATA